MTLRESERQALRDQFNRFAEIPLEDDSLYARIAPEVAGRNDVLDLFENIEEEQRRPVLMFAAVHYVILKGADHPLREIYDAPDARGAAEAAPAQFVDFCREYSEEIVEVMQDRSVQTNEVNRCIGLLPALMEVARKSQNSLALVEMGASAGLNLLFDRYRYHYGDSPAIGPPGATVRLSTHLRASVPKLDAAPPLVEHRIGIDLEPLDVSDEDEELWLRACIWVGEVARDQRLTSAIELARREWRDVVAGDANERLPEVVEDVPTHLELCLFNSWMMGWMSGEERDRLTETVGAIAGGRSVWWITLEGANAVPGLPEIGEVPYDASVLAMRHWSPAGRDDRILALMHHHGAWLDWRDPETSAF